MKKTILILSIITTYKLVGQLPIIKAIGGEGKNIDWEVKIKKDIKEYGYDPREGPGLIGGPCNQGANGTKSSSHLPNIKNIKYIIGSISDDDPTTAWVEGVKGYGIGEWLEIKAQQVNRIYNGYQSSPINWLNNSRVKTFKVYKNSKPLCLLELTDEMGANYFELPDNNFTDDTTFTFRFEIADVYKGLKWDDVCISEIADIRCCFSENTLIAGSFNPIPIQNVKTESEVLSVNLDSNKTSATIVKLAVTQKHLVLYKISTSSNSIEITIDHPLNFKNYGFTSLSMLLQKLDIYSIITTLEIMTWNNNLKKTEFEKITNLEKITGVFNTYAILKLEKGNTYIANGFITKTY